MNVDRTASAPLFDALLGRRTTWNGAVVWNIADGRYYRVAHSLRDASTGQWEIRWNASDEVSRPLAGPVYVFDGTTWDLPALRETVFPQSVLKVTIGAAVAFSLFVALAAPGSAVTIPIVWICGIAFVGLSWWQNTEPVAATKFAYAATAVLAVHNARTDRVLASQVRTMNEDFVATRARIDAERTDRIKQWEGQYGSSGNPEKKDQR